MSGTALPSIIEYSQDLSTQDAPDPVPVGEFPAEIVKAELKQSQTSGNTYCAVSFRINPDAYPADYVDGDPDGTVLQYNRLVVLPDSPQIRFRVKKFLLAVGGKPSRSFDPADLIGLTATVEIEHRDFEDEKQAQIKRVIAP